MIKMFLHVFDELGEQYLHFVDFRTMKCESGAFFSAIGGFGSPISSTQHAIVRFPRPI